MILNRWSHHRSGHMLTRQMLYLRHWPACCVLKAWETLWYHSRILVLKKPSDLKYVTEEDLQGMSMSVIQRRKFVEAAKTAAEAVWAHPWSSLGCSLHRWREVPLSLCWWVDGQLNGSSIVGWEHSERIKIWCDTWVALSSWRSASCHAKFLSYNAWRGKGTSAVLTSQDHFGKKRRYTIILCYSPYQSLTPQYDDHCYNYNYHGKW